MRAIVLSGGLTHDFPATTARLTALLDASGLAAEVHTEVDAALAVLPARRYSSSTRCAGA